MRIHQLGEGTPEVAVVGAIHGDEPCGSRAIDRLVADDPDVERPVKLIVANEEALERGVRYVDEDLNRAFPGDPDASTHEGRLAYDLAREARGCTTLSIHSTQSYAKPFAVVKATDAVTRAVCPRLPVDTVVETDEYTQGRLIELPHVLEVEAGLQGSDEAAENALELALAFLAATGVGGDPRGKGGATVDGDEADGPTVFRLERPIPKPTGSRYEVFADNFELVTAGEAFAAVDGDPLQADADFYPVLLSAYGYEDLFGYVADRVGAVQ
jgi:predicted deacylase